MQCCVCTLYTGGAAECMACIKTSLLNDTAEVMCEQKGRAGAGQWANLVSPRCVTAVLPAKHVVLLVIVSHAHMRRLLHPCRWFQAQTNASGTVKARAFSRQAPGERCGVHRTFTYRALPCTPNAWRPVWPFEVLPFPSSTRGGRWKHRNAGRMIAPAPPPG